MPLNLKIYAVRNCKTGNRSSGYERVLGRVPTSCASSNTPMGCVRLYTKEREFAIASFALVPVTTASFDAGPLVSAY